VQGAGFNVLDLLGREACVVFFVGPIGKGLECVYISSLRAVDHIHCKLNGILDLSLPVFCCGHIKKLLTQLRGVQALELADVQFYVEFGACPLGECMEGEIVFQELG